MLFIKVSIVFQTYNNINFDKLLFFNVVVERIYAKRKKDTSVVQYVYDCNHIVYYAYQQTFPIKRK